jgi:hypothetical protein
MLRLLLVLPSSDESSASHATPLDCEKFGVGGGHAPQGGLIPLFLLEPAEELNVITLSQDTGVCDLAMWLEFGPHQGIFPMMPDEGSRARLPLACP